MKNYEQENAAFIEECADLVDEYNAVSNSYLEDSLRDLYQDLLTRKHKLSPTSFFREVKSVMRSAAGNFESIDIINYLTCIFDDTNRQHTLLQNYFDDVKSVYENLPEEELEYCEENRDAILKSNLKMVISTAKKYRNRGLSLEDLIGAGNVGLCVAWDKFKPEHNALRNKIMTELETCPDEVSKDYIDSLLAPFVTYGSLKEKYDEYFNKNRVYKKAEIVKWVNKNIKKAKFSSVAALWIRAYILQELDTKSRIVKKPKAEIDKDLAETGSYLKENIVPIDPLVDVDESNVRTKYELSDADNTEVKLDEYQNMVDFKTKLNQLMVGINNRDRRILFKSFGIGLPRSMEPKEISETEDLSVARVSQIIQDCITKMKKNAEGQNIYDLLKYLK